MPAWVPVAAKADMETVFKAAIWCYTTLKAHYQIVSATINDGWVVVRIERGGIVADITVGKFKNVSAVSVKDGKLWISYSANSTSKWWWAGGGFVAGVVTSLLIYSAAK